MMYRGGFSQLLVPGLKRKFVQFLQMQERDSEYDKVFNIETSEKAWEDYVEFAGLGPMVLKHEGETIQYDDAIQGGTRRFEHETFALGVRSSWELYKDDQYGLIRQTPKALARSAHFVKEQRAWNVFNLGFTVYYFDYVNYSTNSSYTFPLSVRSGYDEMIKFVELVNPKQIYVTGSHNVEFSADLKKRGYNSFELIHPEQLDLI